MKQQQRRPQQQQQKKQGVPPIILTLTPSMIDAWIRCRRQYYWKFIQRLEKRETQEYPKMTGGLVHRVLAYFYSYPQEKRTQHLIEQLLWKEIDLLVQASYYKNSSVLLRMAATALKDYAEWSHGQDAPYTILQVATPEQLLLTGNIMLQVTPDLLVARRDTPDTILLIDHKCTGELTHGDHGIDYASVMGCIATGSIGTIYNTLSYMGYKKPHIREVIIRSPVELNFLRYTIQGIGEEMYSILTTDAGLKRLYPQPIKRCSCPYWELCLGEMHGHDLGDIIEGLYRLRPAHEDTTYMTTNGEETH